MRPSRIALTVAHRLAILAYIVVALFPLYWLLKVAVTPNNLLYSEGVRMWPSRTKAMPTPESVNIRSRSRPSDSSWACCCRRTAAPCLDLVHSVHPLFVLLAAAPTGGARADGPHACPVGGGDGVSSGKAPWVSRGWQWRPP